MGNIESFRLGKGKKFLKKNRWNLLTLGLILLLGCFFISRKEGYHMDELLSFELANAEFTPWIVTTQPEGRLEKFVRNEIYGDTFGETCANVIETIRDVAENGSESRLLSYRADVYEEPVWISAKQFQDYVTTSGRDRFNYLSVYFNVKDDNHPPLHFMALHTISSLFPGQISPWMGCCINLALLLGICVLLMRICGEFLQQETLGRAACLLYACSMAGIATLLLIRMYAMLTFFCTAALYLHLRKMKSGEWQRHNGSLIFVTICGFLTQYYFVIFMLFLAGVTVVLLWKKYGGKALFYYGRTIAISAALGLCIFPFSIADVLYSGRGVESVQNLRGGFSGIGERFFSFLRVLKEEALGGTAGIGILLLLLTAALAARVLMRFCDGAAAAAVRKREREKKKRADGNTVFFYQMTAIPLIGYFLVVVKIAPYYEDRYLMPVFPLIALYLGLVLQKCLRYLGKFLSGFAKKGMLYPAAALLILPNLVMEVPPYLYQGYRAQEAISEQYADTACLCVYNGVRYYENLPEFTNYKKTLLVTLQELQERSPDPVLQEEENLTVLLKDSGEQEAVNDYLRENYGFYLSEILMRESVHRDAVLLYKKA